MDIDELRTAKRELEKRIDHSIESLLADFQAATGVEVVNVRVQMVSVQEIGKPPRSIIGKVNVDLELF